MEGRTLDSFDWRFFAVVVAILMLGVMSIYSVSYSRPTSGMPLYVRQLLWVLIGGAAFLAMLSLDYHEIARYAYVIYALLLVLLVVVLIAGKPVVALSDGSLSGRLPSSPLNLRK